MTSFSKSMIKIGRRHKTNIVYLSVVVLQLILVLDRLKIQIRRWEEVLNFVEDGRLGPLHAHEQSLFVVTVVYITNIVTFW